MSVAEPNRNEPEPAEHPAEVAGLIASMRTTLAGLEAELHGVETYRALIQLEQRAAAGDQLSVMATGALRRMLLDELGDVPAFRTKQRLEQALRLLDKGELPTPEARPPVEELADAEQETVAPTSAAPADAAAELSAEVSGDIGPAQWVAETWALARAAVVPAEPVIVEPVIVEPVIVEQELPVTTAAMPAPVEAEQPIETPPHLASEGEQAVPVEEVREPSLAVGLKSELPAAVTLARFSSEQTASEAEAAIFASLARLKEPAPVRVAEVGRPAVDRLELISGIDQELRRALTEQGVERFSQIASWSSVDIAQISSRLGLGDRVSREGWIEQAAVLARGAQTARARRKAQGWQRVPLPGATEASAQEPAGEPPFYTIGLLDETETGAPAGPSRVLVVTEAAPPWEQAAAADALPEYVAEDVMIRPRRRDVPIAGAMANVAAAVAATVAAAKSIRGDGAPDQAARRQPERLPDALSAEGQAEVVIVRSGAHGAFTDALAQPSWTPAEAEFQPAYRRDPKIVPTEERIARPVGAGDEATVEIRRPGPATAPSSAEDQVQPKPGQATMLRRIVRSFGRDDRPW